MKKIYVTIVTLIVLGLMYVYPHIMLNPGELVSGHQNIKTECFSCHKPFWGISNEKCIVCHNISEIGSEKTNGIINNKILFHKSLTTQSCSSCHTDHIGLKPLNSISKFSHELVSEDILNNCNGCHITPADNKHIKYKTECGSCHTTNKWNDVNAFKHEFILENELQYCNTCHKNPGDEFHSGITENCNACHSTIKWKPSTFDHSSKFFLDSDHNTKCITCHTNNNYKAYTCYGCHEHTAGDILSEHNEEGINNIDDCVSCHKSANEKDMKEQNNKKNKMENNRNDEEDDED